MSPNRLAGRGQPRPPAMMWTVAPRQARLLNGRRASAWEHLGWNSPPLPRSCRGAADHVSGPEARQSIAHIVRCGLAIKTTAASSGEAAQKRRGRRARCNHPEGDVSVLRTSRIRGHDDPRPHGRGYYLPALPGLRQCGPSVRDRPGILNGRCAAAWVNSAGAALRRPGPAAERRTTFQGRRPGRQ
jgi:hypothetical protein